MTVFTCNLTCNLPWWVPIDILMWPCGRARSCDKLKTCVYHDNTYGHLAWQVGDISWRASTQKVSWSFNYVVLWCHMTYVLYMFTYTKPMSTKYGKMVALHEGHPHINSHNPLNMCLLEVTWQIKNIISPLSQCLCSQDLPRWWHTMRSSHPYICITPQWGIKCKLNTLYPHLQDTYGHKLGMVLSFYDRLPLLSHMTLWLHDQCDVT